MRAAVEQALEQALGPGCQLDDGQRLWSREALITQALDLARQLQAAGCERIASLLDNGAAWVIADLALQAGPLLHVPLPLFFSPAQLLHALQASGADTLLLPAALAGQLAPLLQSAPGGRNELLLLGGQTLALLRLPVRGPRPPLPAGCCKLTFTSGTTGAPKGVCLGASALQAVAQGLVQALEPLAIDRHLCALPLAVLLENIAGLMAPLRRGARCIVPPLASLGLAGSSGFDPVVFDAAVRRHRPDSLILLPQMLRAWCLYLQRSGQRAPASLKLVAVGGAAVGAKLLAEAQALGLPACEGYGLSEGASVQTLNLPGAARAGSAGRPLPHAQLRVTADGEIEIRGSLFLGYLGDEQAPPEWWPSGDLGHIDAQGFVHISGRKKQLLITGFGRNIAPEWVETALRDEAELGQAVVFGEGMAALCAVLWPSDEALDDAALQAALDRANAALPDYARVRHWVRARQGFDTRSGMATANGRPQRAAIWQAHADALLPLNPME